jgi:hypothetical protein
MQQPPWPEILPAEFVGMAQLRDGVLDVGGVEVRLDARWHEIPVYARRSSADLSVTEVLIAVHDGFAEEELESDNAEAARYPLGPKEYWRSKSVGKARYGPDQHFMTDEDFEEFWSEADDDV